MHTSDPRLVRLSLACQVMAVFSLGWMAGFFATYSGNVSPALAGLDGATYAVVQSTLNRHVRHAAFFASFFLPPLWCALALLAGWRGRGAWGGCLLAAALLYALGIVLFTRQVNLPLNAYTESWSPQQLPADWALVRARWNLANHARTAVSALAFLLAIVSLACRRAGGRGQSRRAAPRD
ncbi:DUF1772 domain-containing protein [uncultured Aquincola sp.]|uniref:DUF1772 domain-containing protein n=1 Tax=uncultured Aquincola sp. TaxID=886556 RepID=UPI0032B1A7EA|tara:strand:+ start:2124 stop:2663 length:540 start_codon:yes stop_codon:yes gene_type:complete